MGHQRCGRRQGGTDLRNASQLCPLLPPGCLCKLCAVPSCLRGHNMLRDAEADVLPEEC